MSQKDSIHFLIRISNPGDPKEVGSNKRKMTKHPSGSRLICGELIGSWSVNG
jgi:hypothetical protein